MQALNGSMQYKTPFCKEMSHFCNCDLTYAALSSLSSLSSISSISNFSTFSTFSTSSMLFKFERFLVLKVAERVQLLSREKCSACVSGLVLDQLHDCMKLSLKQRIELFLARAKTDALERLNNLFFMYQQTAWVDDEQMHLEAGENLIEFLRPEDLMDRRFVNEDSVLEYPFNTSWLTAEMTPMEINMLNIQTLPTILPLDPVQTSQKATQFQPKKSSRKRKKVDGADKADGADRD